MPVVSATEPNDIHVEESTITPTMDKALHVAPVDFISESSSYVKEHAHIEETIYVEEPTYVEDLNTDALHAPAAQDLESHEGTNAGVPVVRLQI